MYRIYTPFKCTLWFLHLRASTNFCPILAHFEFDTCAQHTGDPFDAAELKVTHALERSDRGNRNPVLIVSGVKRPHESGFKCDQSAWTLGNGQELTCHKEDSCRQSKTPLST